MKMFRNSALSWCSNISESKGAAIGMGLTKLLEWAFKIFFVLSLIGVGQLAQIAASSNDVRAKAIEEWVGGDQSRQIIANDFRNKCLVGERDKEQFKPNAPIYNIYECGEKIGAASLVAVVKKADSTIETVVWPLSTVNITKKGTMFQ